MNYLVRTNQDMLNLFITSSLRLACAIVDDPTFAISDKEQTSLVKNAALVIKNTYCSNDEPPRSRSEVIVLCVAMTEILWQAERNHDVLQHRHVEDGV